jgi:deoxyribonuclease-1
LKIHSSVLYNTSNTVALNKDQKTTSMKLIVSLLTVLLCTTAALAQEPPSSFQSAKKLLADLHEQIDYQYTLYCGCPYTRTTTSGGSVDREACGVTARSNETRSKRIEWEHVVPASWFGQTRACWKLKEEAYPECEGKTGRKCCESVNEDFALAHNDPNNLFPSVGEVNADRSNYPYGEVEGEPRLYGKCDAEIIELPEGGKLFEPAEGKVRGTTARAMLYMAQVYGVNVELPMTEIWMWHKNNPPEAWEIERAKLIAEKTGLYNEWILGVRE